MSKKQDTNSVQKKFNEHKAQYLKDHSTKEMVFENGAALAFVLKELYKLNDNINQLKNILHGKDNQESKE